jgi:hypothetical protein
MEQGLKPVGQPRVLPRCLFRFFRRRGRFRRHFYHFIQQLLEIFQARGRNDNCVATPAHIFRDAKEAAANIFFQGEHKCFAFDLDLVCLQSVFVDRWPWLAEGTWIVVVVPVW